MILVCYPIIKDLLQINLVAVAIVQTRDPIRYLDIEKQDSRFEQQRSFLISVWRILNNDLESLGYFLENVDYGDRDHVIRARFAEISYFQGNITEAVYLWSKIYPPPIALSNLMVELLSKNQWDLGFTVSQIVLDSHPGNTIALRLYAHSVYRKNNDIELATKTLQHAASLDPDNPDYYIDLYNWAFDRNDLDGASLWMEQVKQISSASYQYLQANLLEKSGDLDGAINVYQEIIKQNPESIDAIFHIGRIMEKQDNLAEAVIYYRQAAEKSQPTIWTTGFYTSLGRVEEVLGNTDKARSAYELVLEVDPQNYTAQLALDALSSLKDK